jgi:hypothetical protein
MALSLTARRVLVVCPFARTFAIVIFLSTCFLP